MLPVAYYPFRTAEYATAILAFDWLYFSRHGIKCLIQFMIRNCKSGVSERQIDQPLCLGVLFPNSIQPVCDSPPCLSVIISQCLDSRSNSLYLKVKCMIVTVVQFVMAKNIEI